ncbi:PAC2 family protein [Aeromicrobium alkaliterrae]|uniref:Filament polymerization regulator ParJ n=1 Tax=Aeromicrobium alkaliterrae TaxID=302168 RepID=A0ABP4VMT9_9ACTN
MTFDEIPPLRNPWMLAAFEGWNDAADAASGAVAHLVDEWDAEVLTELDPEEYYDFQVNRPVLRRDEDENGVLVWPTPTIYVARPRGAERDVLLLRASEPNYKWRGFCSTILGVASLAGVTDIISLGALLADTPHTRPVPVSGSTNGLSKRSVPGLETTHYAGPVGISSVLIEEATKLGFPAASLWAAVPHYLAEPPCPKATLALLGAVEDALSIPLPQGVLDELSDAWQRGAEEVMEDDEEIAEYVKALESERDTSDLPEASGDAIAREFERYLRRRQSGDDR